MANNSIIVYILKEWFTFCNRSANQTDCCHNFGAFKKVYTEQKLQKHGEKIFVLLLVEVLALSTKFHMTILILKPIWIT